MKSRSTLILVLVALAVVGLVALDFHKGTTTDEAVHQRKKIVSLDEADVDRIELVRSNETVVVEKRGDQWDMKKPLETRADRSAVRAIINELEFAERERTLSANDLKGANLAEFGLEPPRVQLTLSGKKRAVTLLLGAETPTHEGVYIKLADRADVYIIERSIQSRLDKSVDELRARDLFDFTPASATRLEFKTADRVIELAKKEGRWHMSQPLTARADQQKINSVLGDLAMLRVQDFVSDDPKDVVTYRLNEPAREVSVWTDKNGEGELTLLIGRTPTNDTTKVYAKLKNADAIVTIPQASATKLNVALNDLREKQVFAFSGDEIHGVKLLRGTDEIAISETNGTWNIVSPITAAADAEAVMQLLDALQNLSIKEFSADVAADLETFGLAVPSLIITLQRDDTNTLAQLLVGTSNTTSGVRYVKRSNEPYVYGVDTNAMGQLPQSAWALRDRQIASLKPESITRLEILRGAQRTIVEKDPAGSWRLVEPAQGVLNDGAVAALLQLVAGLRADEVFDPVAEPPLQPQTTLTLLAGDRTYVLKLAEPDKSGKTRATWSDPALTFAIPATTVQAIQQDLVTAAEKQVASPSGN